MRLKIVDKSDLNETQKVIILNSVKLSNLKLECGEYSLIVEGVFPYNTAEGQLVIDTLSNKEVFELKEVQQCEPVEYSEAY